MPRRSRRRPYPSDLTDLQWSAIASMIPDATPGGRPRKVAKREIVAAILHLLRGRLRVASAAARLPAVADRLPLLPPLAAGGRVAPGPPRAGSGRPRARRPRRLAVGRRPRQPDRQDGGSKGRFKGFDAGEKFHGRKRHIMTDTDGRLPAVEVHAADVQDRDGAKGVPRLARRAFPFVETVFADGGYDGRLADWAQTKTHVALEIVKRPRGATGFVVIRRRWVVERTFASIMKGRRLVRDYEQLTAVAEALITIAAIATLVRRIARPFSDALSDRPLATLREIDLPQPRRDRPRRPPAERDPVDLHHRRHEARGRGGERLRRRLRLLDGEGPLLDAHLRFSRETQHRRPRDPVQDRFRKLARHDGPVAGHDVGVVGGALRHRPVLDHPGVVRPRFLRLHLGEGGPEQLHRLDVPPRPALVVDGDHLGPALRQGRLDDALGLGEQHHRRRDVLGPSEVPVLRAAGDLKVYHPLLDPVAPHQLPMHLQQILVRDRRGHGELAQAPPQPPAVPVEIDELALQHRGHLVDPVGEQEPPVEDRDLRLRLVDVVAVHVDRPAHAAPPLNPKAPARADAPPRRRRPVPGPDPRRAAAARRDRPPPPPARPAPPAPSPARSPSCSRPSPEPPPPAPRRAAPAPRSGRRSCRA